METPVPEKARGYLMAGSRFIAFDERKQSLGFVDRTDTKKSLLNSRS
jgi:hypothetical protein